MASFTAGSSHICHLVASVSNVKLTCLFGTHPPAVSPRLCPWSTTLRHVHHSSQYPHFLLFSKPSPLRRWHSTLPFLPSDWLDSSIDHTHNALDGTSSWITANLLRRNFSQTEFLLIGHCKQLAKIDNSSFSTTHSGRNFGFIFDEHRPFSDQILSVSKYCYYHIRQLCCIHPYLDTKTTSIIATSVVQSRLDYCNSLYHNLPKSQITRLQHIQNSLARAVVKAPKSSHITPILPSLHWLKITERIEYKLLSLTYKVLTTTQPSYLHNLITVQPPRSTRSSSLVTLARPSTWSFLRIRSFLPVCFPSTLESTPGSPPSPTH